jgi:hypothetical protein
MSTMEKIQIRREDGAFIITNDNSVKLIITKEFLEAIDIMFEEKDVINMNWNGKDRLTLIKE